MGSLKECCVKPLITKKYYVVFNYTSRKGTDKMFNTLSWVKLYFPVYHSGTVFLEPSTSVIFVWKKSSFFQLFSKTNKKKTTEKLNSEMWSLTSELINLALFKKCTCIHTWVRKFPNLNVDTKNEISMQHFYVFVP